MPLYAFRSQGRYTDIPAASVELARDRVRQMGLGPGTLLVPDQEVPEEERVRPRTAIDQRIDADELEEWFARNPSGVHQVGHGRCGGK